MKRLILLALAFAGCASGGSTSDKVRQQWRNLTQGPPAFSSPGDPTAMAPTPDNGPFGSDATSDCSGCPPR
jgi:hypothetical protein